MTFGQSIATCFRKYATFTGTASRSEFWWFQLFQIIVTVGTGIIDTAILQPLAGLALVLPCLAVGSRRLRDVGRSPWWLLLYITIVGALVLIYWWVQPGRSVDERQQAIPEG